MSRGIPPLILVLAFVACAGSPPGPRDSPPASPSSAASASPGLDPAAPLPSPIPEVLARVNGQPVLAGQIAPYAKRLLDQHPVEERQGNKARAVRQALREYIERELLFQEAVGRGLKADDRAVQLAYDRARVEHADEKKWTEFLAASGFDPQSYKAEIRVQETVNVLLRRAAEEITVTDGEAQQRYEAAPEDFPPPEGKPAGFDSVREHVKARLREERRARIAGILLGRLRARARIETYI